LQTWEAIAIFMIKKIGYVGLKEAVQRDVLLWVQKQGCDRFTK